MPEHKVAAMISFDACDADTWASAGEHLGQFLEFNSLDGEEPAHVVMEVSYIPEDDDYLIRLPSQMTIWIPRWQLDKALELSRTGGR